MSVDNDMNRLEDALKHALRQEEAPEGFADRVLNCVAKPSINEPATRRFWRGLFAQPLVRWAAAAAVCAAVVICGIQYRQAQQERAEGEAAKQQLVLALRIAGSKLQLAKSKVQQIQATQNRNQEERE